MKNKFMCKRKAERKQTHTLQSKKKKKLQTTKDYSMSKRMKEKRKGGTHNKTHNKTHTSTSLLETVKAKHSQANVPVHNQGKYIHDDDKANWIQEKRCFSEEAEGCRGGKQKKKKKGKHVSKTREMNCIFFFSKKKKN